MFIIDTNVLKENFIKYYSGEESGLKCIKTCVGILLYGAGLEKCSMGGISLSACTNVILRIKEDETFKIISADRDMQIECDNDSLKDFNGDKLPKSLFKACAILKGDIKGAEILIDYSIHDMKFKRPVTALVSALGLLDKGKITDFETVKFLVEDCAERKYSFLPAELYGRKNTIINRRDDGKWEYLPFNLSGFKVVLAYADDKSVNVKRILSKVDMEKYAVNEAKRSELIKKNTSIEHLGKIFKASAYELFGMMGKSAEFLCDMYKISEETGISKAIVPIYSMGGICAFVEDADVDKYIEEVSLKYQKKAGVMPTFCICDSDSSGIISDIESE